MQNLMYTYFGTITDNVSTGMLVCAVTFSWTLVNPLPKRLSQIQNELLTHQQSTLTIQCIAHIFTLILNLFFCLSGNFFSKFNGGHPGMVIRKFGGDQNSGAIFSPKISWLGSQL